MALILSLSLNVILIIEIMKVVNRLSKIKTNLMFAQHTIDEKAREWSDANHLLEKGDRTVITLNKWYVRHTTNAFKYIKNVVDDQVK